MIALCVLAASCTRVGFDHRTDASARDSLPGDGGPTDGTPPDGSTSDGTLPKRDTGDASPLDVSSADAPPPGTSRLSISPPSHRIAVVQGQNPTDDPIFVRNLTSGQFLVTAAPLLEDHAAPCPWIAEIRPISPVNMGADELRRFTIQYDAAALPLGIHRCLVEITAAAEPGLPWIVPITLEVKSAPTITYLQSWEQSGCTADGASAFTGAECDYSGVAALDGSELLRLDYNTSYYADRSLGALPPTDVLYLRVPIYFSSFQGIESPEIFVLREGNEDAYPKLAAWPGPDGNSDGLGDNRDLYLRCKPTDPPGDHDNWLGITAPVDQWIVIRMRIELTTGAVHYDDEGDLWQKRNCSGAPLSYSDLGYAFRTTWGRTLLIDRVEISDVQFASPLSQP